MYGVRLGDTGMEMEETYDIVIVGAGPAGLAASIEIANEKISVLVLDRKQEIGCPKRCAEGLGLGWFNRLKIKPKKEWAVQPIHGAALYAPNGEGVQMKRKENMGFVLERKIFEKDLAMQAVKAGAKILLKHQVIAAERKNEEVILTVEADNETTTIRTPLVIACDGVDSLVAKMLGLNTKLDLNETDAGYQYEMTGISGYDEHLLHLYFGTDVAPRGYCLTPESEVFAKNSVKEIAKVKEGDEVFTLKGLESVKATSKRPYKGDVIDLTPRMINKKVGLTTDHKVLTWNKKSKKYIWKKSSELIKGVKGKRGTGDYLVFPIPKIKEKKHIVLSDYYDGIIKDNKLFPKGKNQYGTEFAHKHGITNKLLLTNDLLYLMGFFVAEGNTNSNGIILSNTKKEFIDKLIKIGKKEFGFDGTIWIQKREKPCHQLHFASKIIKNTFANLFGVGSKNKKVPAFFFGLNKEKKKAFLKGYFDGDGCIEKSSEGYEILSFATSSKHLSNDIWGILSTLGIVAAIGKNKQKNSFRLRIRGKQLEKLCPEFPKIKFGKNQQIHGYRLEDGNILLGIKELSTRHYDGMVFDIQTNGSFCVPFVVHNCWIFPKRKGTANVGIGIGAYEEKTAKYYLDKWIKEQDGLKNGSIIEVNAGAIPVGGFLDKMQAANLIVAGDAGHMVDPIHGGGIGIALEGGRLAAKHAIKAVKEEKYSEEDLEPYTKDWYDTRGNELMKRLKGRHLLEQLTDDDFNYLAGSITMDEALKIGNGALTKKDKLLLFTKKLVTRPGLVKIFMKYMKDDVGMPKK